MLSRPKRPCTSHQPLTAPGTVTESGPVSGMCSAPRALSSARRSSSDVPSGLRPAPLYPCSCCPSASHRMTMRSPPSPHIIGSTTLSNAFAAIAASTALPPASRMASAARDAPGCAVAAIPSVDTAGERDAKRAPIGRSPPLQPSSQALSALKGFAPAPARQARAHKRRMPAGACIAAASGGARQGRACGWLVRTGSRRGREGQQAAAGQKSAPPPHDPTSADPPSAPAAARAPPRRGWLVVLHII